jgi:hypothetical protein
MAGPIGATRSTSSTSNRLFGTNMNASEQIAAAKLPSLNGNGRPASQHANQASGATHFFAPHAWKKFRSTPTQGMLRLRRVR